MCIKKEFNKLDSNVHLDRFDKEERVLIKQIRKYHKDHPDTDRVNMEIFSQKFFLDVPCTPDEVVVYRLLFKSISKEPDPEVAKNIIRDLRVMEFNKALEDAQNSYILGEDIDLYETVADHVHYFESDIRRAANADYCKATVQEILEDHENGSIMPWKLRCLQESMPGVRTKNQIIVALRPGRGKTSFMVDNCVHWLKPGGYLRESNRPVLWFNNEGDKLKIKGSFLRCVLCRDFQGIQEMGWERAQELYDELIGGPDMVQIYDIHNRDYKYLQRIIEDKNPGVVVWDMLDNVRGFSADRRDQELESLYQWAREMAVQHDFLSLITSQVSDQGANLQWIPDNCLKDSRTGKQGACDAIITIGTNDDPGFERVRYVYIPKEFKGSPLEGASPKCLTEVIFDSPTCRYLNAKTK